MSKVIEQKIGDLIAGDVDAAGYELVRVYISGAGKYSALQIMAERKDGAGMNVDDCAVISKLVSVMLEADKDLADKYDLEVSSPGIDRPLVRLADYARYAGHVAKVELSAAKEGQKRFQGKIAGVAGDVVGFDTDKGKLAVAFGEIEKAKLVLTDELLKAAKSGKVSH